MNVMLRSAVISTLSVLLLLSGCAQRDNRFDPSSPLHVDKPPVLQVSCNFGTIPILKSINDSEFIVRPHTMVTFEAGGYEAESDKPLQVLVKIVQNGEIKNIKQDVTKIEIDLSDSGRTEIIFITVDDARLTTEKKFTFDIQPYKKPIITSFKTESDTIRVGRTADVVFVSTFSDPDTMLDSIKFIWGVSQVLSKKIISSGNAHSDSTKIQLLPNSEGTTRMCLIAIDREGRTDTSSLLIVSNARGKIGNLIPPIIEEIYVERPSADSNFICFSLNLIVFNGDVDNVRKTWSFGGDDFSTGYKNSYCKKFSTPGTHKLILTVEDQAGAIAIDSIEVFIPKQQKKPFEIYKLSVTPDSGCFPLRVEFKVELPPGADPMDATVIWKFGDKSSKEGRELHATHTYEWPASYYVEVILSSNGGNDTIFDTINVFSYIQFNYMNPVLPGQKTAFWVTGVNKQNVKLCWTFPDTSIYTRLKDTCYFAFRRDGTYEVKVDVHSDGGVLFEPYKLQSVFVRVGRWY